MRGYARNERLKPHTWNMVLCKGWEGEQTDECGFLHYLFVWEWDPKSETVLLQYEHGNENKIEIQASWSSETVKA
jgi:hypothetical protein